MHLRPEDDKCDAVDLELVESLRETIEKEEEEEEDDDAK